MRRRVTCNHPYSTRSISPVVWSWCNHYILNQSGGWFADWLLHSPRDETTRDLQSILNMKLFTRRFADWLFQSIRGPYGVPYRTNVFWISNWSGWPSSRGTRGYFPNKYDKPFRIWCITVERSKYSIQRREWWYKEYHNDSSNTKERSNRRSVGQAFTDSILKQFSNFKLVHVASLREENQMLSEKIGDSIINSLLPLNSTIHK